MRTLPVERPSIPVLLVTGYLGAGKTTLLNRLLALPEIARAAPALIVNEFGPIGIDARLLPPGPHARYEINNGSLFCACTKPQLLLALREIAAARRAGIVLIESTGVAETRNLQGPLALPELTAAFCIRANICLVDAVSFIKVAPYLRVAIEQVRRADGLVVNKCDLAAPAEVETLCDVLREINPGAPQVRTTHGALPDGFLAGLRHTPGGDAPDSGPPGDIVAAALRSPRAVDRERFEALRRDLGTRLLRLKGNIAWRDGPTRYVEVVGGILTEREECEGLYPRTAFTVIAWKTPREALQRALDATLAAE